MARLVFVLLLVLAPLGLCAADTSEVAWRDGERLVYTLYWRGIPVGTQYITASKSGRAWHYSGKVDGGGLSGFLGFKMSADSYTRSDLFTRRFQRDLTIPGEGRRVLNALVDDETKVHFVWVDGSVHTFSSPQVNVLDDLSVLYYVRVNPGEKRLWFINFPKLVSGGVRSLGSRLVSSPKGKANAQGFVYSGDDTRIEVWYGQDETRLPLLIIFGQEWGTVTALLQRVEYAR